MSKQKVVHNVDAQTINDQLKEIRTFINDAKEIANKIKSEKGSDEKVKQSAERLEQQSIEAEEQYDKLAKKLLGEDRGTLQDVINYQINVAQYVLDGSLGLHEKNGAAYNMTIRFLELYRLLKYQKVNEVAAHTVEILTEVPVDEDTYTVTLADVSYILDLTELTQTHKVPLNSYLNTKKLPIESNLITWMDTCIQSFRKSSTDKKVGECVKALKVRYLDRNPGNGSIEDYEKRSGLKRMTYYSRLEEGIKNISMMFWGVTAPAVRGSLFYADTTKAIDEKTKLKIREAYIKSLAEDNYIVPDTPKPETTLISGLYDDGEKLGTWKVPGNLIKTYGKCKKGDTVLVETYKGNEPVMIIDINNIDQAYGTLTCKPVIDYVFTSKEDS